MRTTTLRTALRAWREALGVGPHPPLDALWRLASDGVADPADAVLSHVIRCARCAAEVRELAQAMDEAAGWDVALAKAASAALTVPLSVTTACGRYSVAVHPRAGSDEAVVTVEVAAAFRDVVEGATVTVTDGAGRQLLSAPIVLGRASARLHGLASLDCTRLVVRADARAGTAK